MIDQSSGTQPGSWAKTALVEAVIVIQAQFDEGADLSRFNPLKGNSLLLFGSLVSIWVTVYFITTFTPPGFRSLITVATK